MEEEGKSTLRYLIVCDPAWRTRAAAIAGETNWARFHLELSSNGAGEWIVDGAPAPCLARTLDVDLGFTPATNTLPIRRLSLSIGESAVVESAWLRFPGLTLERLKQTYTREADTIYRYVAIVDGVPFAARLDTDGYGRVLRYEGLWEMEPAGGEQAR